jgi:type II secretory pathway component PulJ
VSRGASLLEVLVAAAITSLSVVGIYALAAQASMGLERNVERAQLQTTANEMVEAIAANELAIGALNMQLTDCAALQSSPPANVPAPVMTLFVNWCIRLDADLGVAGASDVRSAVLSDQVLDGQTYRVVRVQLSAESGRMLVTAKRVLHETS